LAKGITNATVPMGAVVASNAVHEAFMAAPAGIEFFHGYTYSSHVLACAASIATLDTYAEENLFERAAELSPLFEQAAHSLANHPNVIDIRNLGLVAGIELAPRPGAPGARAYEAFVACYEAGLLVRATGDILAISPPLIISEAQIDELFTKLGEVLKKIS
jgi:beta-alanine--pyruvate transaminase